MYFHVIENTRRDGQSVYRRIRTYQRYAALERFLRKEGRPLWVVESKSKYLPINGQHSQPTVGGHIASYWNEGGWGVTTMPLLPLAAE